jgi:hypothetical protein
MDPEKTLIKDVAATWFDSALQEARSGDLESALSQAQIKAQTFIDCQISTGKLDVQTLSVCARQADPEHWLAKLGSEQ